MSSTRAIIAQILSIPDCDSWSITDSVEDKGLYNVHYTPEADKTKFGWIRGVVVDINKKYIVCQSYGHTPTIVSNDVESTGILNSNPELRIGYEGTIIRVFKHEGVIYTSTHRRIVPNGSRWGNSRPFAEIYRSLNGPTTELFSDTPNSRFVYVFLITDPELLSASVINMTCPWLFFLDRLQFDPPQDVPCDEKEPDSVLDLLLRNPKITPVSPITVDHANYQLNNGFRYPDDKQHSDIRLKTGEFVIAIFPNSSIVRINSVAYEHRLKLRQCDPNFYHNYVELLQYALRGDENYPSKYNNVIEARAERISKFNELFTVVSHNDEQFKEAIEYLKANPVTILEEFYNPYHQTIFFNFWLTLPVHARKEALTYYNRYYNECRAVVDFLMSYHNDKTLHVGKEVKTFVDQMEKLAVKGQVRTEIRKHLGGKYRYLIYTMISEMNKYNKRVVHMNKKMAQSTSTTSNPNVNSNSNDNSVDNDTPTVYDYINEAQNNKN